MHTSPLTGRSLPHHSEFLTFKDLEIITQKIAKVILYFRKLECNKSQNYDLLHLGVNFDGFKVYTNIELKEDFIYNNASPNSSISSSPEPPIKYAAASSSSMQYKLSSIQVRCHVEYQHSIRRKNRVN